MADSLRPLAVPAVAPALARRRLVGTNTIFGHAALAGVPAVAPASTGRRLVDPSRQCSLYWLIQGEIRSIVPLGRDNYPHDSRHFVPGYIHAVPPGTKYILLAQALVSERLCGFALPLALLRRMKSGPCLGPGHPADSHANAHEKRKTEPEVFWYDDRFLQQR
jgi:hypothetical protein